MEVFTSSTVVSLPVPLLGMKRDVIQTWIVFKKNEELWLKRILVWKLKGRFLEKNWDEESSLVCWFFFHFLTASS